MKKEITYGKSMVLEEKIANHYIPYRIQKGQKFIAKNIYYNYYWNMCIRIIDVLYDDDDKLNYIYAKADDHTYHWLSSDLDYKDLYLEKDEKEIYKTNIINNKTSYTGAQIVYWFYINKINCFNKKYKAFWKFVDDSSAHRLSDYNHYFLIADKDLNGNYINCKIIKDPKYNAFYKSRKKSSGSK